MRGFRLFLLSALLLSPALAAQQRPNIIIFLCDDMGLGDVSCYGGSVQQTPNIDRLAENGVRFTQYYSASPICSPSRAGLITGMYPGRWRITSYLQARKGNRGCAQADYLDAAAPSLPRALKKSGYVTAHIGKWHLGGGRDVTDAPKFSEYGYDEHVGTYESPEPHPDITATDWIWSNKDKVKRWERTDFFVEKTLEFLKRHPGQPCFVNLWPDDPHTPWVPAANASKGDTRENLRPVLANLDKQVGRLVAGLKELGIAGDTLLIFTSDNGPLPTFNAERSTQMRGSKLSLFEAGVRVPFIVHWPGKVPAGRVDNQSVIWAIDLLPSLCKLAGAELPEKSILDGKEMSAALLGAPVERPGALYWEYGRNNEFYKFPSLPRDRSANVAVREGNWKLLINADGSGAELYDLSSDANEKSNLAEKQSAITRRLSEQALSWRKSLP